MKVLLNAGFGSPVGVGTLADLKARGFSGIRQDILNSASAADLVGETLAAGMPSLFIVRDPASAAAAARALRGKASWGLEIGNEEDSKQSPENYYRQMVSISASVRVVTNQVALWTAGITTMDRKRLNWLERVYELGVPYEIGTCVHTYRQELPPSSAVDGFTTRKAEFAYLRKFIGDRRLANSELGWHTAEYKVRKGWFKTVTRRWTDEQVASHLQGELQVLAANNCEFATVFQLNDGPTTTYEHRFGMRRVDGTWKPQAAAVADWVGKHS